MANTTFKLSGLKDLEDALLQLSTGMAKRIGRKALRDGGKPILDDYKARTTIATGTLVNNENMGTRLNKRQRKLSPRPGPSEIEIHIGTADPAGIAEEFGNRHQAANPSLTPAWDMHGGARALEKIAQSLGDGIEREAARTRRG
ncbi:hypothetical protein [Novosphingobium olei]|uniref:hypothetical protein n=1 Tax=Novosphingobium olei TaxID=2728851 RepID=UPI00308889FD|nr:HK97 gp10 family phage protein [Novosphingobium olei]